MVCLWIFGLRHIGTTKLQTTLRVSTWHILSSFWSFLLNHEYRSWWTCTHLPAKPTLWLISVNITYKRRKFLQKRLNTLGEWTGLRTKDTSESDVWWVYRQSCRTYIFGCFAFVTMCASLRGSLDLATREDVPSTDRLCAAFLCLIYVSDLKVLSAALVFTSFAY